MQKAEGETISSIIGKIAQWSEQKIKSVFESIGNQLGNLDSFHYARGKELLFKDSNAGNFIYDEKSEQLYLIDYSQSDGEVTALIDARTPPTITNYSFARLFNYRFYKDKKPTEPATKQWADSFDANRHLLALTSLFSAYAAVINQNQTCLSNANLKCGQRLCEEHCSLIYQPPTVRFGRPFSLKQIISQMNAMRTDKSKNTKVEDFTIESCLPCP